MAYVPRKRRGVRDMSGTTESGLMATRRLERPLDLEKAFRREKRGWGDSHGPKGKSWTRLKAQKPKHRESEVS